MGPLSRPVEMSTVNIQENPSRRVAPSRSTSVERVAMRDDVCTSFRRRASRQARRAAATDHRIAIPGRLPLLAGGRRRDRPGIALLDAATMCWRLRPFLKAVTHERTLGESLSEARRRHLRGAGPGTAHGRDCNPGAKFWE
jgi:hypothetical protein